VLIVQEYIGETLQTYLEKENTADNTRENANSHRKDFRKDLAHLLLQNVNTLHCEKYTHRDLKPNNLFVKTTLDGKPTKLFIGDYGLAVHSGRIRKPSFPNTHYYWGPEMNVSKHIHMQKVDSWSVGMILLELLYNTKPEPTNILHQNDIETYLDSKCTPDKCCKCCIDNHEHLKQIIHSLLLYAQEERWTVYDALLTFENVFSLQSQPPPPQPPQPLPPLPSPKTSNLKEDQSPDAKNATMKIAFTLALLTATAMLMAKGKKTNTRRQLFTQKRQHSAV
jgi:serine/threonine protein kinase